MRTFVIRVKAKDEIKDFTKFFVDEPDTGNWSMAVEPKEIEDYVNDKAWNVKRSIEVTSNQRDVDDYDEEYVTYSFDNAKYDPEGGYLTLTFKPEDDSFEDKTMSFDVGDYFGDINAIIVKAKERLRNEDFD